MVVNDGLPIIAYASPRAWEVWLDEYHGDSKGLWIKIAKQRAGIATVTYAQAVECALCYGWIDGQRAAFDEQFFLQRFTPRGRASKWSKVNTAKALQLIEAGRMKPGGLRAIEQAQQDGRWQRAYEPQSSESIPADFALALAGNPAAAAFFATVSRANRFAVLYRFQDAKKPETRARRIDQFVAMLARGETVHLQTRRPASESTNGEA